MFRRQADMVAAVRVLLLGSSGQVGFELRGILSLFAHVLAPPSGELDISDSSALTDCLCTFRPSLIINAAAFTNVDGAERDPSRAMQVNGHAVRALGELAIQQQAALIHLSTDFVFAGDKGSAYTETDPTGPINAYGRTKLVGEEALLSLGGPAIIFRTAWVYGLRSDNFVTRILSRARQPGVMRVVEDQVGSPTSCVDLAEAIGLVAFGSRHDPLAFFSELGGLYHLAGGGRCSRLAFARAVLELDPRSHEHQYERLEPATSEPFGTARPADASLDCERAADRIGVRLPPWRSSLARALGVIQDGS